MLKGFGVLSLTVGKKFDVYEPLVAWKLLQEQEGLGRNCFGISEHFPSGFLMLERAEIEQQGRSPRRELPSNPVCH